MMLELLKEVAVVEAEAVHLDAELEDLGVVVVVRPVQAMMQLRRLPGGEKSKVGEGQGRTTIGEKVELGRWAEVWLARLRHRTLD